MSPTEIQLDVCLEKQLHLLEDLYRLHERGDSPSPELRDALEECMYALAHCLDLSRRLGRERTVSP